MQQALTVSAVLDLVVAHGVMQTLKTDHHAGMQVSLIFACGGRQLEQAHVLIGNAAGVVPLENLGSTPV